MSCNKFLPHILYLPNLIMRDHFWSCDSAKMQRKSPTKESLKNHQQGMMWSPILSPTFKISWTSSLTTSRAQTGWAHSLINKIQMFFFFLVEKLHKMRLSHFRWRVRWKVWNMISRTTATSPTVKTHYTDKLETVANWQADIEHVD